MTAWACCLRFSWNVEYGAAKWMRFKMRLQLSLTPAGVHVGATTAMRIGISFAPSLIGGFHMASLKFKLENYWWSWDFTFMMYKSSWKLVIIQSFAQNVSLVLWWTTPKFLNGRESCHVSLKSVLFRGFGYLISSSIRKKYYFNVLERKINSRFCSKHQ